jgi:acyl dehydratase
VTQQTSLLTEALRQAIGKESSPVTFLVEKGPISEFAEAIGDPNPVFTDEAKARLTRYGSLVAPPTFLRSTMRPAAAVQERVKAYGWARQPSMLHGGGEWEYFEPIRPGDTLSVTSTVLEARERQLSVGLAVFIITLFTYKNQFGRVAATQKDTMIFY